MDLAELFNDLRGYNGQSVTLRIDELTLTATIINVAQLGSDQHPQIEVNVQFDGLGIEDYRSMQRMIGKTVDVQIGALQGRLAFDAVSPVATEPDAFQDDADKPMRLTFAEPATTIDDDVADTMVDHGDATDLVAGLRAAGYAGLADEIDDVRVQVERPGYRAMQAALHVLRSKGRVGLAERLARTASRLYGEARPIPDLSELIRKALAGTELDGCDLTAALAAFHAALQTQAGPNSLPERTIGPHTQALDPGVPFPQRNP